MTSRDLPTRPRRIVRRAVMGTVLVACLCWSWLAMQESPEIQRSRALRIGMTMSEATSAMEESPVEIHGGYSHTMVFYYGQSSWKTMKWFNRARELFGLRRVAISAEDWPVAVHFRSGPSDLFVYRIERGDEVEEVPLE